MKNFIYILTIILILFTFISCGSNPRSIDSLNYEIPKNATIYEDAEDGKVDRWEVYQGYPILNVKVGANGSNRSIFVKENWIDKDSEKPINNAHYELYMDNNHQFILEFDKMKVDKNNKYCFRVGVKLDTKLGKREISFNPFYDKENMKPASQWLDNGAKELIFPLSMSYVLDVNVWKHLRFNLPKYLHQFEPDNDIISVEAFYFEGGNDYLDNILLTSK